MCLWMLSPMSHYVSGVQIGELWSILFLIANWFLLRVNNDEQPLISPDEGQSCVKAFPLFRHFSPRCGFTLHPSVMTVHAVAPHTASLHLTPGETQWWGLLSAYRLFVQVCRVNKLFLGSMGSMHTFSKVFHALQWAPKVLCQWHIFCYFGSVFQNLRLYVIQWLCG